MSCKNIIQQNIASNKQSSIENNSRTFESNGVVLEVNDDGIIRLRIDDNEITYDRTTNTLECSDKINVKQNKSYKVVIPDKVKEDTLYLETYLEARPEAKIQITKKSDNIYEIKRNEISVTYNKAKKVVTSNKKDYDRTKKDVQRKEGKMISYDEKKDKTKNTKRIAWKDCKTDMMLAMFQIVNVCKDIDLNEVALILYFIFADTTIMDNLPLKTVCERMAKMFKDSLASDQWTNFRKECM